MFSSTLEQHIVNLRAVFERLRKYDLKLRADKCNFLKKEGTYLGHKITDKGILPDDNKFSVIKQYLIPKTTDEVKRFIAFANYYRKFIKNFALITQPLNHLTKKNVKFIEATNVSQL